jgi:hypothetical protein
MSVVIPDAVKQFLSGKVGWVATASKDGMPNVSIKGSLRVLDEGHLVFADLFSIKTRKNLEENPKVAVMVADVATREGYILKGTAELLTEGPAYDHIIEELKKAPRKMPNPKYAVKITVTEIYDQGMGPNGGKRLA